MPSYSFLNPETGEIVDVVQRMTEPHTYSKDGVEWQRQFCIPQTTIDNKIDPFDSKAFVRKTGNFKGNLGDVYAASAEASEKRKKICGGKDPVQQKYFKDWSSKHKGKIHPRDRETKQKLYTIEA